MEDVIFEAWFNQKIANTKQVVPNRLFGATFYLARNSEYPCKHRESVVI
ncbi:hypothetical protein LOOC260_115600 [Paucilactobacillus hokkaidonensis JCM 18461]|uniref:Uncharacterized protein n=1 Tax=Paucilactobacillus hokkaidonensis JCM 18461 TaxID=1291742 RepID=A0A0A1GVQ9_9LACO|nr:hypothetical protein LOOC260_115600 [Paucilactobacillus hokkaidonensis JCM 18461]